MIKIINKYASFKDAINLELIFVKHSIDESIRYNQEHEMDFLVLCESGIYEATLGITFFDSEERPQIKTKSFKRRDDLAFVCNEYEEYDAELADECNPDGFDEDYDYNDYVVTREDEKVVSTSELKNEDRVVTLKNYWCKKCGSIHRCWENVYSDIECPVCGNGGAFNNTFVEVDHFETKDGENFAITVDGQCHKI